MTEGDRVKSSVSRDEIEVEPLPSSGGLGISFRYLLETCWGGVWVKFPQEEIPGEDPGHSGGTISFSWSGNALGSGDELKEVTRAKKSGCLCWDHGPHDSTLDKR